MRPKLLLTICWLLYAGLVVACVAKHEPWFDEGQSWLLARDCGLRDLLLSRMRYEGSPGLWQIILMPFAKLGMPYTAIGFISASFASLGVAILFWRSPFPPWMRIGIAFSYIVLYQYAVVARSYSLLLPLLCAIAAFYRKRVEFPIVYSLLVALLANVSVHAAFMAAVLFVEWLYRARKSGLPRKRTFTWWCCAAGIALLYVGLFFQLRLPQDLVTPGTDPARFAGINRALTQISEAFAGGIGSKTYEYASKAAGVLILGAFCFFFRASGAALLMICMMVPALLIACFRQSALWHSGIIFLIWMFAFWVFLSEARLDLGRNRKMCWLTAAVLIVQAGFGLNSIRFDIFHTYSGSEALARYLIANQDDRDSLYAIGFKAFAVQPYFDRNLFEAQENGRKQAFYAWRKPLDHGQASLADIQGRSPERIILGSDDPAMAAFGPVLKRHGYCRESEFDGGIWWKNAYSEPDSYRLFRSC